MMHISREIVPRQRKRLLGHCSIVGALLFPETVMASWWTPWPTEKSQGQFPHPTLIRNINMSCRIIYIKLLHRVCPYIYINASVWLLLGSLYQLQFMSSAYDDLTATSVEWWWVRVSIPINHSDQFDTLNLKFKQIEFVHTYKTIHYVYQCHQHLAWINSIAIIG